MERETGAKERAWVLKCCWLTRIGAGLAVVAMCTVVGGCLLGNLAKTQEARNWGVVGVAGLGVVLALCQFSAYRRKATSDELLYFYRDPHFWGPVMGCGAIAIYVLLPIMWPLKPVPVIARENHARPAPVIEPVKTNTVEVEVEPEFPPLRVTGVVVNGSRSSAVINGRTVMLGESIENVEVAEVAENGIVGRMKGYTHRYWMEYGRRTKR